MLQMVLTQKAIFDKSVEILLIVQNNARTIKVTTLRKFIVTTIEYISLDDATTFTDILIFDNHESHLTVSMSDKE